MELRKRILIYGAGGFGREVQWLIERINQVSEEWIIEGYLDDGVAPGTDIDGYKVLGGCEKLKDYDNSVYIACAIAKSSIRKKIIEKIRTMGEYNFPNLIDPCVNKSQRVKMGEGNIVCAGTVLSVDLVLKDFVIIDWNCTVGHDAVLESYVTAFPSVNISGNTSIAMCVEVGTGTQIIQGINIGENTIIGAGSVVIRDVPASCTAVGVPIKVIKNNCV